MLNIFVDALSQVTQNTDLSFTSERKILSQIYREKLDGFKRNRENLYTGLNNLQGPLPL